MPGSAQIFVEEFQNQARHRQELEQAVVRSDIRKSERGQHYSFICFLAVVLAAGIAGGLGHDKTAIALTAMDVFGFGTGYVFSLWTRRGERKEKAERQSKL